MTTAHAGVILTHIRHLAAAPASDVSDRELLERFRSGHDEAAFEALVRRYGPLVLGVCRRVLGHLHDAEDAFQATFLVLAQTADTISKRDSVSSWLYGVAFRVASKARDRTAVRRRHERHAEPRAAADPLAEVTGRELLAALDAEVAGLPERCRVPLVHCYLEGLTCDEAARAAGWPLRTLKRRLEEGRNLLRARLARRGLALPAALLAAGATQGKATAVLPPGLVRETVEVSLRAAAGQTPATGGAASAPLALAQGLLTATAAGRLKLAAAMLLGFALVGLGVGALAGPAGGDGRPGLAAVQPARPQLKLLQPPGKKGGPVEKKAAVAAGRVLGADGKPLAGAEVALVGMWRLPRQNPADNPEVFAQGKTDADGKFRLEKARATLDQFSYVGVFVWAKGHGLNWVYLVEPRRMTMAYLVRPAPVQPGGLPAPAVRPVELENLEVKLSAEQVIRGRLFDLQGVPAAGAKGRVVYVSEREPKQTDRLVGGVGGGGGGVGAFARTLRKPGGVEFRRPDAPAGLAFWPRSFTADKEGRFDLRGFGAEQAIHLLFEDDRFATQELTVETAAKKPKEVNLSLAPPQRIEGRVIWEDTGKPAVGLRVGAAGLRGGSGNNVIGTTDAEGRFRLNPYPGSSYMVSVAPREDAPYLPLQKRIQWPQGAARQVVDLKLQRGVLLKGRVVEASTGAAVDGAVVSFVARKDNPNAPPEQLPQQPIWGQSAPDGSYRFVVPAGPGHLLVDKMDRDLVLRRTSESELSEGKPGGARRYYDAVVPLDLKTADSPRALKLEMRRGVTIRGEVVGPDGKPVKLAVLFVGDGLLETSRGTFVRFVNSSRPSNLGLMIHDGKFELRGCDPEKIYKVYVLDVPPSPDAAPGKGVRPAQLGAKAVRLRAHAFDNLLAGGKERLGVIAEVSAKKAAGKAVTIKLAPCTAAQVRFVNGEGKPSKQRPVVELVVTPADGKVDEERAAVGPARRGGPEPPALTLDDKGVLTIPALIPGATYYLKAFDPRTGAVTPLGKAFTAEAGKTLKLPDAVTP